MDFDLLRKKNLGKKDYYTCYSIAYADLLQRKLPATGLASE
jgi:hypothetical protein